jgi:AcrR family transcriptional regulator
MKSGLRGAAAPSRARGRTRRTQEERSAATRARVVEAATECVAERGFRGATMSAMAERAGVSWGAMQHQFGEKDAIFDAVLEHALLLLKEKLADLRQEFPDPAERVHAFVSRSRQLLRGPVYRAFVEIQVNRSREDGAPDRNWSRFVGQALSELWRDLFGDLQLPKRQLKDAQRFTFAVLSGISSETMLFPRVDFSSRHFEILEETLLRLLDLEG